MAVFSYRAVDSKAVVARGTIKADTAYQARELLRSQGLRIRFIEEVQSRSDRKRIFSFGRRHQVKAASTIRELATLLGAGIPILDCLDTVAAQHSGAFRTRLLVIREKVAAGGSLADAFAEQHDIFDSLCKHMIEVGETSGTLDEVMQQLGEFKERTLYVKNRVITALAYPALLVVVMLAITIVLMTAVMPVVLENLEASGKALPLPTRIVKGISDFLIGFRWAIVGGIVLALIGFASLLRHPTGKRLAHRLALRIPVVGTMIRKQSISQLSLILGTLTKSGVEFLKAADIAARSTKNLVIRSAIVEAAQKVQSGAEIGYSLEQTGVFPPLVIQIFSVGQQSGQLDTMLLKLADDYDREVALLAGRLTAILEPLLILTLAAMVGLIMAAVILPLLESGNVL